jgi:hypothetical protein
MQIKCKWRFASPRWGLDGASQGEDRQDLWPNVTDTWEVSGGTWW